MDSKKDAKFSSGWLYRVHSTEVTLELSHLLSCLGIPDPNRLIAAPAHHAFAVVEKCDRINIIVVTVTIHRQKVPKKISVEGSVELCRPECLLVVYSPLDGMDADNMDSFVSIYLSDLVTSFL